MYLLNFRPLQICRRFGHSRIRTEHKTLRDNSKFKIIGTDYLKNVILSIVISNSSKYLQYKIKDKTNISKNRFLNHEKITFRRGQMDNTLLVIKVVESILLRKASGFFFKL